MRQSTSATVAPTQIPGVIAEGFGIRSGFAANVRPAGVDVATQFGISGIMGLVLILVALWAVDRYL